MNHKNIQRHKIGHEDTSNIWSQETVTTDQWSLKKITEPDPKIVTSFQLVQKFWNKSRNTDIQTDHLIEDHAPSPPLRLVHKFHKLTPDGTIQ